MLADPARYTCRAGVPVFKPHRRILPEWKSPDGTVFPEVVIEVRERDLPIIATVTNAAGPQPLTEGHRKTEPDFPEHLQPRKVGWEINHRPGTFSPDGKREEPCILADLYYEADKFVEVGPDRYPFRSVDYDRLEKRLAGTALLVRRPFLDLGVMPYDHRNRIVTYEAPMPDPKDDDDKPEDKVMYAKVLKYLKRKQPRMAAYLDDDPDIGYAGSTEIRGKNQDAQKRAMWAKDPSGDGSGSDGQYSHMEQRLAQSECERLLDRVATVKYDRSRELAALMGMPEQSRPAHVQYMLDTYQKLVTAVPSVNTTPTPGMPASQPVSLTGEKLMTRAQMEAALQYQSSASVPYEAARLWAMANIPAGN